jgi:hypothetical protein
MAKGEDFFKDTTDDFSKGGSSSRKMFDDDSDRLEMVEEVYNLVLGRKPSSRELSYYKYSISNKEEIMLKLLNSREHKDIISNSLELPNIKEQWEVSKLDNMKLNQKLLDMGKEQTQLQGLLAEQRAKITDLRSQVTNPYELPSNSEKYEEGFDVYQSVRIKENSKEKKKSFKEKFKEFILLMFE